MAKRRRSGGKRRPKRQKPQPREDDTAILDSIKIHPLLQGKVEEKVADPVRKSHWKTANNPYIDQSDMALANQRQARLLPMNEQGKYIEQAKVQREKWAEERQKAAEYQRLKERNLVPDESLGEQYYEPEMPPAVEWWDRPLLLGGKYDSETTYKDPSSEENPITAYIQHPVPINAPWEKNLPAAKPLYLTKTELKRLRRNERLVKMREKQDRIKLGMDPAPPPKVKLKNLMNVLTNETIKNPTQMEMKVKREVAERQKAHELANQERALSKEERKEKWENSLQKDVSKGVYCCVFRVGRLVSPRNAYKVDMNAKEWELTGSCLNLRQGASLVIAEGGEKAVRKYKKLMLSRIKWQENERKRNDESDEPLEDLSQNYCRLVWEGELSQRHFSKWTVYNYETEESLVGFLAHHSVEGYWRA